MKVLYCSVTNEPEVREIDGSLESMQHLVGGYIEVFPHESMPNIIFVMNEEGKLQGLPVNVPIRGGRDCIAGDLFLAKADGEEIVGLSDTEIKVLKEEILHIRRAYR